MEYECIEEGRALIRLLMLVDQCQVSISKVQMINVIKGKREKSWNYKLEKLESAGADLIYLKELFKHWKNN